MRGRITGGNNRGTRGSAYRRTERAYSTPRTRHTKDMVGTAQGARTPRTQSDRAQAGQHAAAPPHRAGRAHIGQTQHAQRSTREYTKVHSTMLR